MPSYFTGGQTEAQRPWITQLVNSSPRLGHSTLVHHHMHVACSDNMEAQLWIVWVIHSAVKWDKSYWSLGSNHCKEDMKWRTQQALKNQSSISVSDCSWWLGNIRSLTPIGKPRDSQGQPSLRVFCRVPPHKPVQEPRASPGPTIHSCFVHWVTPPVRHHPVLVTEALQGPPVLLVPSTPGLTPWQLCHCSLVTYQEGHLSDRQLWKFFIKDFFFSRKDRLLYSSDMLYLLWHETTFLFLLLGDV